MDRGLSHVKNWIMPGLWFIIYILFGVIKLRIYIRNNVFVSLWLTVLAPVFMFAKICCCGKVQKLKFVTSDIHFRRQVDIFDYADVWSYMFWREVLYTSQDYIKINLLINMILCNLLYLLYNKNNFTIWRIILKLFLWFFFIILLLLKSFLES